MPPLPWKAASAADSVSGEVVMMASLLQLDSLMRTPSFLRAAMAIRRQVLAADGTIGVALDTALPRRTFFTLSAWRDRDAIDAFIGAEPHRSSMRRFHPAMTDARFVFWNAAADQLPPSWSQAKERLRGASPKE